MFVNPEKLLSDQEKEKLGEMHLGILTPPWIKIPPEGYGGIEAVIYNFLRSKAASYIGSISIFGHPDNALLEKDFPNVHHHMIPGVNYDNAFGFLQEKRTGPDGAMHRIETPYAQEAYATIADMGIDIVHDHTMMGREFAHTLTQKKIPVLQIEHGPVEVEDSGMEVITREIYNPVPKKLDPYHRFVAISGYQQKSNPTLNWYDEVVPNGIDMADFDFNPLEKGHSRIGKYGLYLGRINKNKGVDMAMDFADAIGMPLIIAGHFEGTEANKSYEKEMKKRIKASPDRYIQFGNANKLQRMLLLAQASWFASLIRWPEPFGLTNAEAIASGTPPVATRRGALPEIIANHGMGILVQDTKDAVEKWREFNNVSDEEKLERALRGREYIENKFSTDAMSANLAKASLHMLTPA